MKNCRGCNQPLQQQELSKDQWNTSRCSICYRTKERNRRRLYRQVRSSQKRTCPDCSQKHISPGYCGARCADCFRQHETLRKANWRINNREKDRERLKRFKHNNNLKVNQTRRKWKKVKKQQLKLNVINDFGGSCTMCGYNKNLAALVFHHVDPKTKDTKVSDLIRSKFFHLKVVKEELKKCTLLCANCHAETHHPDLMIR